MKEIIIQWRVKPTAANLHYLPEVDIHWGRFATITAVNRRENIEAVAKIIVDSCNASPPPPGIMQFRIKPLTPNLRRPGGRKVKQG